MAGFIELIAKIKPKNNGKYALVDDVDVEMEDGTRLSEAIKKPRIPDGGTEGQILAKKSDKNGDGEWVDPLKTEDIDKKLESKLDKNLGSENSDKVLTTDSQGNIITQNKEDFEGGGGTTNYDDLENKPQINGVELIGNRTSGDLKMYTKEEVDEMLYDKMDKPYKSITITDDITIEDCLDGYFKIDKIKGNTYQAQESDIIPTPQRQIPINSRKTTITKINPNIFDFEKENDTSNIPDSGTYRSIGQYQLKANTKYIFEWSEATVPAKATLSFQIQDDKGTVLVSPFTYFNLEATEKKEAGKEVEFTTNSSGIVKFAYNCTVASSNTTETYQQYWYTKILKDISLKEDVEYTTEYVELRSLKETINKFDLGLLSQTDLISDNGAYRKIEIPIKLKPNTRYKIYYEKSMIPALTWAVLNIVDNTEKILIAILNVKNTENNEVEKQAINTAFTSPIDGEIYFSYFVQSFNAEGVQVPQNTEIFKEKWFTKILKNIMITEESLNQNTYVLPTIRDYKIVDHTSKTSKIVRNVLEIDANNIKAMLHTSNEKYISFQLNTSGIDANMLPQGKIGYCSLFLTKSWNGLNDYEMVWIATASMGISISKDRNISDVEQFLQFVKEKDIKIFAKLATPTEESIPYSEDDVSEVGYSWQDTTSPSPSIKSEVQGVEEIDILKTGKNLFDIDGNVNTTVDNAQNAKNSVQNGILTSNYNSNNEALGGQLIKTENGKQYTISLNVISIGTGNGAYIAIYRNGEPLYSPNTKVGAWKTTITATVDEILLAFGTNNGTGAQFTNIQIEVGDTPTSYEPYAEQRVNITPPQPLRSTLDGSVADEVDIDKKEFEYKLIDLTFDGSIEEKWVVVDSGSSVNTIRFNITLKSIRSYTYSCEELNHIDGNIGITDVEGLYYSGSNNSFDNDIRIRINKDRLETPDVNGLRKWLQSNPLHMTLLATTPTTQPIPEEDLVKLKSLKTERGVTNIFVGGEIKPTINARYPRDLALVQQQLEQKILLISDSLIDTQAKVLLQGGDK